MIVILGSTHDDILYFESIMSNKKEVSVMNRFPAIMGNIFNQETILVYNVYSNYVSSVVTSYLNERYFVLLVFNVGKVIALNNDLSNGDIVVSKKCYLGDVDLTDNTNTNIGEIPEFPAYYETQFDVIDSLENSLEIRTLIPNKVGTYISLNKDLYSRDQLNDICAEDAVFGENKNIVLDSTLGGVCVACAIQKIPFVAVKVVYKRIGEKTSAKEYANVLKSYTGVGKAIVTCIGNISRNDIIRGEEH